MDELIGELKAEGVLRSRYVQAAFRAIDRKDFVLPEYANEAYGNYPLPIGGGQTISQPYTVAFMLDLLDPKPGERILDVGSGSGWTSALLAHAVSHGQRKNAERKGSIYAMERIRDICEFGRANIEKYGFITNGVVTVHCRDGSQGLAAEAPFDKILASAAAGGGIPDAWREELRVGGKIVAPVGNSIWCLTKQPNQGWDEREYPGFAFVPLVERPAEPGGHSGGERSSEPPGPGTHYAILFMFAVLLAAGIYATFVPQRLPRPRVNVEIPAGTGLRDIGAVLARHGVVRSRWAFVAYAALSGNAGALKAGEYTFEGSPTIPEVVHRIVQGERYPTERLVTIPEGWDLRDMGGYFEANGIFMSERWWEVAGFPPSQPQSSRALRSGRDFANEFAVLADKPPGHGLEGYLYPDSYRIFRTAAVEDVVRKMLENFDRKLTPELRNEIRRQNRTIFEIVTVASLLEKEVPHDEDRRIVAGILWKRLAAGIPLQVDASVNYLTGKRATPSAADLAIDSPFNTYRYAGLPYGPIANPGIGAIRAAVYSKPTGYFYYLSSADGTTVYSRSIEEHRAAKARYLR